MKKIIQFCISHFVTLIMSLIILIILGIVNIFKIELNFLPYIRPHKILITTVYSNLPAQQIKDLITSPIENSVSSVKSIKNIESVSRDGLSCITLDFHFGCDIDVALFEVQQTLDKNTDLLPENCPKSKVVISNTARNSDYIIGVTSDQYTPAQLSAICSKEIIPSIQKINGISELYVYGSINEEIIVECQDSKAVNYGISNEHICCAIGKTNYETPVGKIYENDMEYQIKTSGIFSTVNSISKTIIPLENNIIKLSDIARVYIEPAKQTDFFFTNNCESLGIFVKPDTNSNPLIIADKIQKLIAASNENYQSRIHLQLIQDPSKELKSSLILLLINIITGILFTVILIYIFFKSKWICLIISLCIPFSILFSIIILSITGKSLNLFSIMGIAVSLGMVVDSSIVTTENIIASSLSLNYKIILDKTSQVYKSNLCSSLTTVVVFIPLIFVPGIYGQIFCELAVSVISSIIFSQIYSFTIIPSFINYLYTKHSLIITARSFSISKKIYQGILNKTGSKNLCLIISVSVFLITAISTIIIPKKLYSTVELQPVITINYNCESNIDYIKQNVQKLCDYIKTNSSDCNFTVQAGINYDDSEKTYDCKYSPKTVTLKFHSKLNKKQKEIISKYIQENYGSYDISYPSGIFNSIFNISSKKIIQFDTQEELENFSSFSTAFMPDYQNKITVFSPDLINCSFYNIQPSQICQYVDYQINGIYITSFINKDQKIPIKLIPQKNTQLAGLFDKTVYTQSKQIPLKSLGNFSPESVKGIYYRNNKKDCLIIDSIPEDFNQKVTDPSKDEVLQILLQALELFLITMILLYCLTGAQFESFRLPFILLISILPALCGALIFLLLTRSTLDITALIGIISLGGISINNCILMYESCLNSDKDKFFSVIDSCTQKLPAVIITNITSIAGLFPFIFSFNGMNAQAPLSIALTGGLIFSLTVQCLIIPGLLSLIFKQEKNEYAQQ